MNISPVSFTVIPAKAGIHPAHREATGRMGPRLRWGDEVV
jgi:hypothetical protein